MTAWLAVRRATLLISSGPDHDPSRMHLHIVLNDPFGPDGEVLLACVCSIRGFAYETSCTLFPGEHSFVKYDSYIAYDRCSLAKAAHLETQVASGAMVAKETLNAKVFKFVLEGFEDSTRVRPKYKSFLVAASGG